MFHPSLKTGKNMADKKILIRQGQKDNTARVRITAEKTHPIILAERFELDKSGAKYRKLYGDSASAICILLFGLRTSVSFLLGTNEGGKPSNQTKPPANGKHWIFWVQCDHM